MIHQDKQCAFNLTLSCFRGTNVAVEKKVLHILILCL